MDVDVQTALYKSIFLYIQSNINNVIWVRSWRCGCLVTWFCYQLIAKPGNKTVAVSWPDPYNYSFFCQFLLKSDSFLLNQVFCIHVWYMKPWVFWTLMKWMVIDFYIWYHYIFNPYQPNPLLSACIEYSKPTWSISWLWMSQFLASWLKIGT